MGTSPAITEHCHRNKLSNLGILTSAVALLAAAGAAFYYGDSEVAPLQDERTPVARDVDPAALPSFSLVETPVLPVKSAPTPYTPEECTVRDCPWPPHPGTPWHNFAGLCDAAMAEYVNHGWWANASSEPTT